jgi:hypothetical protein
MNTKKTEPSDAQQMATVESHGLAQAEQPQQGGILGVIERASRDPSVNVEHMERLLKMYREERSEQAKVYFDDAMSLMQPEMPTIKERGKAIVQGSVRYTYALWEDMNEQIKPVLAKHGFSITFRTDFKEGISVTGVLAHKAGHREETSILLPADVSGSKNAVQAVASTVSYGKRYTAGLLLNLTTHGEDDDAYRAAPQPQHGRPMDGVWESMDDDVQAWLTDVAQEVAQLIDSGDMESAVDKIKSQNFSTDEKAAIWTRFSSKQRTALKKASV